MALKLAKTTDEGFTVEYWRVSPMISVDMVARTAHGQVVGYVNAAARQAGKRPVHAGSSIEGLMEAERVTLEGATFEAAILTGELRDAMYAALKTTDFFTGSEDV